MARTIRNSARDPHKRNSFKRDVIGGERRRSKRSDWKDLRTVTAGDCATHDDNWSMIDC